MIRAIPSPKKVYHNFIISFLVSTWLSYRLSSPHLILLQVFHHLFCLHAFTCSSLQGQKNGKSYLSIKIVKLYMQGQKWRWKWDQGKHCCSTSLMKQNSHTELGLHAVIKNISRNAGVMESPAQSKVVISCNISGGPCSPLRIAQLSAYNQEENKETLIFIFFKSFQKEK